MSVDESWDRISRWLDGFSAFLDDFGESVIRLGMLDTPAAQKRNQVFRDLLRREDRHDSCKRPSRFDKKRGLTVGVDPFDQIG